MATMLPIRQWSRIGAMNIQALSGFKEYVNKQILPASSDVSNLDERSRKHVQKLIYASLVDQFDSMVDAMILENCRSEHLVERATAGMTQQITEADLLKLLMQSGNIQDAVDEKLRMALRNSVLRVRHSKKLAALLRALEVTLDYQNKPKVNVNTGHVIEKMKPFRKTIPHSICGYADWLYSRRNAVVHSTGTSFLENDRVQLKKLYNCEPAKKLVVKLSSVRMAAIFYNDVVSILEQAAVEIS